MNGLHGKPLDDPDGAIAELGGLRDIRVEVARPDVPRGHASCGPLESPATKSAPTSRRERRTAKRSRRSARPHGRRRPRRRGLELDVRGDLREGPPGEVLRDVHRGAADGRRRGGLAGCRLAPLRVDVRGVPLPRLRLRTNGSGEPCHARPLRIACRRLDRRGRSVADGARGHRRVPSDPRKHRAPPLRREPGPLDRGRHGRDRRDLLPARLRPATPVLYAPDEEFEIMEPRPAPRRTTTSRSSAPASPCTRRYERQTCSPRTGSPRASSTLLDQAARRDNAGRSRRGNRRKTSVTVEDHWPEGGLARRSDRCRRTDDLPAGRFARGTWHAPLGQARRAALGRRNRRGAHRSGCALVRQTVQTA